MQEAKTPMFVGFEVVFGPADVLVDCPCPSPHVDGGLGPGNCHISGLSSVHLCRIKDLQSLGTFAGRFAILQ